MHLWSILGVIGVIVAVVAWLLLVKRQKTPGEFPKKTGLSALSTVGSNGLLECPLIKSTQISHDTFLFIYKLPSPEMTLGIQAGEHIVIREFLKTKDAPEGEEIVRKYTPTSRPMEKGQFELLIKVYRKNVHPKFPEGGVMTQYLESLKIGDKIKIQGPRGKLNYHGNGHITIQRDDGLVNKRFKQIAMIAGGTGITPIYQIIMAVCDHVEDETELFLIFANKAEEDILLKIELEAAAHKKKLKLYYTLDYPPAEWKGFHGFITQDMLMEAFPKPSSDVLTLCCGPPPMMNLANNLFKAIGYDPRYTHRF